MSRFSLVLLASVFLGLSGCEQKAETVLEPLPSIEWQEQAVTPFLTSETWKTAPRDWKILNESLRYTVELPEALETRLSKDDREIWKDALENMERSQLERKDAAVMANIQMGTPVQCEPPGSALSLQQRSQLQLTLQLHRNVLWRMGRLEMASRGVSSAIQNFLPQFSVGRIKDADQLVVAPIMSMVSQIDSLRENQPVPKGVWMPGEFHFRMARTAHAAPVFIEARQALMEWESRLETSERWKYLETTPKPMIEALDVWVEEYEKLIQAYRSLTGHIQVLEREFAPPHALVAYPCINQNLRSMRIISELYNHILPMQWALAKAHLSAGKVKRRLQSSDYAGTNHEYLTSEVDRFMVQLESQQAKLTRAEDLILISWDELNAAHWRGLPDFIDPIHHHPHAAVENAEKWNLMFHEIRVELDETRKRIGPEPEQPLNKRGKPLAPYISSVLETLHAPSRIDEAERSLLAISEVEAHLVAIRDELLRLCKQGACRSFPEAELANSPRKSAWIVTWRQAPSSERTLGHSLIVIKLCQLHLSRLVQRLTEIYAWFAETSNADLSWKKLKSWQRIWTLYAEPNGTYANFLRSVAALDNSITEMAVRQTKYAESDNLHHLLYIQDQFFDLTLDYARLVDGKSPAPILFDELVSTWEDLDNQLVAIEKATIARDEAANPDLKNAKPKRHVVDIPR